MPQKYYLTTKNTKYTPRTQIYVLDCELFDTFVFCLGVLGGKNIFAFRTTSSGELPKFLRRPTTHTIVAEMRQDPNLFPDTTTLLPNSVTTGTDGWCIFAV